MNNNNQNNNIPNEILTLIHSGSVYEKLEKIANKYNLFIDQLGQLNADTEMVMIGKIKSSLFVKILSKDLEISENIAQNIAEDINTEILDNIRDSLRTLQEQQESQESTENTTSSSQPHSQIPIDQTISAIEKAGQFTVEKEEEPAPFPKPIDDNLSKEELLKHLEGESIPLVDHLLTTPVSNPTKVEVKKVEEVKPIEQGVKRVDPYREQI